MCGSLVLHGIQNLEWMALCRHAPFAWKTSKLVTRHRSLFGTDINQIVMMCSTNLNDHSQACLCHRGRSKESNHQSVVLMHEKSQKTTATALRYLAYLGMSWHILAFCGDTLLFFIKFWRLDAFRACTSFTSLAWSLEASMQRPNWTLLKLPWKFLIFRFASIYRTY